jgi:hypothetical protein
MTKNYHKLNTRPVPTPGIAFSHPESRASTPLFLDFGIIFLNLNSFGGRR